MGKSGWPKGDMRQVGGRDNFNRRQQMTARMRRVEVKRLMLSGVVDVMAIRERLLVSHPTLPLSASSIRRDLAHIHGEWEAQNRCPHCGHALPALPSSEDYGANAKDLGVSVVFRGSGV